MASPILARRIAREQGVGSHGEKMHGSNAGSRIARPSPVGTECAFAGAEGRCTADREPLLVVLLL